MHFLRIKEAQFEEAISAALGMELSAFADPRPQPDPDSEGRGGGRGGVPTMTAPVSGQTFGVQVRVANRSATRIELRSVLMVPYVAALRHRRHRAVVTRPPIGLVCLLRQGSGRRADQHEAVLQPGRVYRESLHAVRLIDFGRPFNPPPFVAVANYALNGVDVAMTEVVRRRETNLPYGFVVREVRTVPRAGVTVSPMTAVVPLSSSHAVDLDVTVTHNASTPTNGDLALTLPAGWTSFRHRSSRSRFSEQGSARPIVSR